MELVGRNFVVEGLCPKTFETVDKVVKLVGVLDGPGSDRRDYCTIEGYYDWDIDIPLENFIKMIKEIL